MIMTFAVALCVLVIALYVQARVTAWEIRRHRAMSEKMLTSNLVLNAPSGTARRLKHMTGISKLIPPP